MRIRIFDKPRTARQLLRQEGQARYRLVYLLKLMDAEMATAFDRECERRLMRADWLPPHHTEYHVPNQGCLLCEIEIAEELLLEGRN